MKELVVATSGGSQPSSDAIAPSEFQDTMGVILLSSQACQIANHCNPADRV